jgi:hypothetical protein
LDYANGKTGKTLLQRARERHWPAYQSAHIEKRGEEKRGEALFKMKKKKMKFCFSFFFLGRKFSGDFTRFLLAKRNFAPAAKKVVACLAGEKSIRMRRLHAQSRNKTKQKYKRITRFSLSG